LPILAERGYLIPAINNTNTDYTACAVQLAHSIRQWHPDAQIAVVTDLGFSDAVFDHVIALPYGDQASAQNKQCNDWQMFEASPFRQTIKLEADMIAASPIDHWWNLFELRDVVISQGARDIYDRSAESRFYRQLFDRNHLPDVYNAITYWRYSKTARDFFDHVKNIFENWSHYQRCLLMPDAEPTTDVVYAVAAVLMGPELVTLPQGFGPSLVHMKQHMIPTHTPDWTQELIWEYPNLRIQTVAQWGMVHYNIKTWRADGSI
jgi:hypothetical protein